MMLQWLVMTFLSLWVLAGCALLPQRWARLKMWLCAVLPIGWLLPWSHLAHDATVVESAQVMAFKASLHQVSAAAPSLSLHAWAWLGGLVTMVGLALLFWDAKRYVSALRALQRVAAEDSRLTERLAALVAEKGGSLAVPRVRTHTGPTGAMVSGLFKPTIWVSRDLVTSPHLATILRHEWQHLLLKDNAWLLWVRVLERLCWWNPLVHLLARQARYQLELHCDWVCWRDDKSYDRHLAALLWRSAGPEAPLVMANLGGSPKQTLMRLKALRQKAPVRARGWTVLWLVVMLGSLGFPIWANSPVSYQVLEASESQAKSMPVILKRVEPKYPEAAIKNRLVGEVTLSAVFTADGSVTDVAVVSPSQHRGIGFEASAIKAVKKWTFKPGTIEGRPVDVKLTLRILFELD